MPNKGRNNKLSSKTRPTIGTGLTKAEAKGATIKATSYAVFLL